MPQRSYQAHVLDNFLSLYKNATRLFVADNLDHLINTDFHEIDTNNEIFLFAALMHFQLRIRQSARYAAPRRCRKHTSNIFIEDLSTHQGSDAWLSKDEFLCKYRVSREQLDEITQEIKDDPIFSKPARGKSQMPVKHQLMIWLHFIGHEGNTCANQREVFKVSKGMCRKAHQQIVIAFNNIREHYICWPDEEERKAIAQRIERKYHLPNCPMMMDGTLLRLSFTPESDDAADYHGRKFLYSLTVNILNDDKKKIRAYLSGFPGSTHDNRVWKNMKQFQLSQEYFSPTEYVLCDTAYEPMPFCVPAYKCVSGDGLVMHPDKALFNMVLSKPRVMAEHTMGLWKGRCPWLRGIKMKITDNPESLQQILKTIDATIVLHNMLLEGNDVDSANAAWDASVVTELTALDDADRIPERIALDDVLPHGGANELRRDQLMRYCVESYIPHQNLTNITDHISLEGWSPISEFIADGNDSDSISDL